MTASFTRSDYMQLPQGFPAQLIEGDLVKEPAPTYGHQRLASRLHLLLTALVGADLALQAPVDVILDEHNVYQPDLVVLRRAAVDTRSSVGIPLIAIEILSPPTCRQDQEAKAPRLLAAGTREVWIIDPGGRTIERRTSTTTDVAYGSQELHSGALPGFVLAPARLFTAPR